MCVLSQMEWDLGACVNESPRGTLSPKSVLSTVRDEVTDCYLRPVQEFRFWAPHRSPEEEQ